jgi:uncharacterized phage protein gp47/JayE
MAGLTATGIEIKTVSDILADIESNQIANIDPDLNVGADDVLGQLNGIIAAAFSEAWELLEEIYHSAYPDTASGQSLSYIAALTGVLRNAASKAELDVRLTGTVGTIIPVGTRVYVDEDPDSLFETLTEVIIAEHGGTDYIDTIVYAVTEGSYPNYVAGTDTLVIATPIAGLTSAAHVGADPFREGNDEETDAGLRQRREQSLALPGASTVDAMRSDMLTVIGVDSCTVFENPSPVTDADGVPPYAVEVLVYSEGAPSFDPLEVVQQIWESKPAGTETYGGALEFAVDSQGNSHVVYYSEPTTVNVYIALDLVKTTDGSYVGDDAVKAAIADWGTQNVLVGQSIYASDIINVAADMTGVVNVVIASVKVDDQAIPFSGDLTLTSRQLGVFNTSRITVNS